MLDDANKLLLLRSMVVVALRLERWNLRGAHSREGGVEQWNTKKATHPQLPFPQCSPEGLQDNI
jgi:hypothetical protein